MQKRPIPFIKLAQQASKGAVCQYLSIACGGHLRFRACRAELWTVFVKQINVVPPHRRALIAVVARSHVEDTQLSEVLLNNVPTFHVIAQTRVVLGRAINPTVNTRIAYTERGVAEQRRRLHKHLHTHTLTLA